MVKHTNTKFIKLAILAVFGVLGLGLVVYALPPVRERVNTRLELWSAQVRYMLNPPEEVIFMPQGQTGELPPSTLEPTPMPSQTPTSSPTATLPPGTPTSTPEPTATPTQTPTPLPASARIDGIVYQHQHGLWNYCAPSTLAMQVSFWGPQTDRLTAGAYLRGGLARVDDKNVMPYEMQNYVQDETDLRMIVRMGGNIELLKNLIANGFPVIVEKQDIVENVGWLGHYLLLFAYDDAAQEFITMDSYRGENMRYPYATLQRTWRPFNYLFMVSYPVAREAELFGLLGPWVDDNWANLRAYEIAQTEIATLTGLDQYFAWFNLGTSSVALLSYYEAAAAYDTSFQVYAQLPEAERPWRMLWYQTGPYKAYYYAARYQDVIALANQTLDSMKEPILEESFYWRALGKEAIGDWTGAVEDMQTSVELNANFTAGIEQLKRMNGGG